MQAKLQVQQQQSPQALQQTQQATRPALERDLPPCPDTVLAKRVQVEAEFSASAKSNGDAAIKEESSAPPVASPYNGTATGMKSLVQSESTAKTSATLEEPDGPTVDDSGLASVAAQQLLRGSFMTCSDIYDLTFIYKLSFSASNPLSAANIVLCSISDLVHHSVLSAGFISFIH